MNITYLLGAGASYNALPIVEKIPERLDAFANNFDPGVNAEIKPIEFFDEGNLAKKYLFKLKGDNDLLKKSYKDISNFHNDILWLKEESSKHSSIDTFAKKLFLQEDVRLKKMKYILSCFFLYEQTLNFDNRYDSFFASILDSLTEIPSNLKIVSWNYDSQLEIAYNNFSKSSIANTKQVLNVISKGNNILENTQSNKFTVFKINGTTSISHATDGVFDILSDFSKGKENLVEKFLSFYSGERSWEDFEPNMSFAWEKSKEDSVFQLNLINSIRDTDILIVIGYSFPFFNRKTDKMILSAMKNLKKIYVQDPKNAADIMEKINGFFPHINKFNTQRISRRIEFIPKTFVDQFFIPIEF